MKNLVILTGHKHIPISKFNIPTFKFFGKNTKQFIPDESILLKMCVNLRDENTIDRLFYTFKIKKCGFQ